MANRDAHVPDCEGIPKVEKPPVEPNSELFFEWVEEKYGKPFTNKLRERSAEQPGVCRFKLLNELIDETFGQPAEPDGALHPFDTD